MKPKSSAVPVSIFIIIFVYVNKCILLYGFVSDLQGSGGAADMLAKFKELMTDCSP